METLICDSQQFLHYQQNKTITSSCHLKSIEL